jgi:hypothetical protein
MQLKSIETTEKPTKMFSKIKNKYRAADGKNPSELGPLRRFMVLPTPTPHC